MNLQNHLTTLGRLGKDWKIVRRRGIAMACAALFIAIASLFNPAASILHGKEFSWLPLTGLVILLVGALESIDAYMSQDLARFFLHLQNGVFDLVAGALMAFSVSAKPGQMSLLIVAYLIVRAVLRICLVLASEMPQRQSMLVGAGVSIGMGLLIWGSLPSTEAWLMSLCLAVDLGLRGWSQTVFAAWLKDQSEHAGTAAS